MTTRPKTDLPTLQAGWLVEDAAPLEIDRALDNWQRASTDDQRGRAAQQWMRAMENAQKSGESIVRLNDLTRHKLGKGYGALMRQVGIEQERGL